MKKLYFFLLLILTFCTRLNGQTGHFIPSDRFSSSLISYICQDKYGSIWIATDYGLNRFDGYRFESFLHSDENSSSICNNAVVCLLCDRDGRVWVGTNRGLDRFDEGTNNFTHYTFPEDVNPRVTDMLQLSDGSILVATAGFGTFLVGNDGVVRPTTEYSDNENERYFNHIIQDSRGRIWITAYDNSVLLKQGKKFERFQSKGEPLSIIERGDEILVIGNRGIMSYHNGRMTEADIDMSVFNGKDVVCSSACKDGEGNIYIGTRGCGLYRVARGSRRLERVEADIFGTDLNTAKVWSILADRRGNLWLGLQRKGLVFIPQRPMQFNNWSFEAQGVHQFRLRG